MNIRLLLPAVLVLVPVLSAQSGGTALVRHAPSINGTIDGSVQQTAAESVTLNGGGSISGDLLVPGTPSVRLNGKPIFGGTIDASGASTPANYQITLNGNTRLGRVVRRTDPVALPAVTAPPLPAGSRSVTISAASQSAGNFATLRHLILNGNVGQFAVPPGTYGDFTANGGSGFTLGVAGATQPAVYNFQHLTLNGQAQIQVLGPVVITVAYGFSANGVLGSAPNPAWLALNIYSGGFTLNGGCTLHGFVNAPNGTTIINGNSQLIGGLATDRLTLNGGGVLRLINATTNHAPVANNSNVATLEDTAVTIPLLAADADGDPLSYAVLTAPAHGTLTGNGATHTYTPAANYNGPDSFTFKVNDGHVDSNVATVAIAVTPQNDAPTADPKSIALDEDTSANVILSGSDVDGDALAFTVATSPSHGSLTGTAPNLIYTPAQNYFGADTFTYTATDGALTSTAATVAITVRPLNDAPIALAQNLAVSETGTLAITLGAADVDGDALAYAVTVPATRGTLSGTAPNLTYRPTPNSGASDSFTFRATDPSGASSTAVISIQISNVNDAPIAASQSLTTPEDTPLSLTLSGSDPDGDAITFIVLSQPQHGWLSGSAPNLIYTPPSNYNGSDSFTFKVRDTALVDSNTATVSLAITPVNDAPVATAQTATTDEDTPVALTLAGTDVENSALTFTIVATPQHGALSGAAPNVTYTPDLNYNGADSFTFKVNDGELDSAMPATVSLNIRPVNDEPSASAQTLTTAEDTPVALTLAGSDVENSPLTFVIVTPPAHGSLSPGATNANYTYTPAADYNGADSFTFKANDGDRDSEPAAVSLAISAVNDPPIAVAGPRFVGPQDVAISFTLAATDADGDALTFAIVTPPAHGVLSGTAPNLVYTPAFNYRGDDALVFTASDAATTSNQVTITFTLTAVAHAPVASDQAATLDEDTPTPITLAATDLDADTLSYVIVTPPAHGTLTGTAPNLVFTPTANYQGADAFTFRASDGGLESNVATVALTVRPVNDAPTAASQSVSLDEDTPAPVVLTATDVDGDALAFAVVTMPAHGTLSGSAPNLTYTPAANYYGADGFTFKATDPSPAASNVATVSLLVAPVNDAPVANAMSIATDEDTPLALTLSASDVDGDALTFAVVNPPAHGTVIGTGATLTYAPAANYNGPDSFTFKVRDGSLDSVPAPVAITVRPVNDAPIATPQTLAATADTPLAITLTGSDVEASSLVFSIRTPTAHGTLSGVAPNLIYTSSSGYVGPDSFTFTTNDGSADSTPATVDITVRAPNHAPRIVSQPTRTHLLRRAYEASEAANVSTWTPLTFAGTDLQPVWTIQPDKRGATEEINSEATVLLSDIQLQDSTIEGYFSVGTDFDDDFIGFVFGYQDAAHFYVFDWKQQDQDTALRGMSVKVVSAESPVSGLELDPTAGSGTRVRTLYHNTISYADFTEYRFVLTHRPGDIHISIYRGTDEIATIAVPDATYSAGRFGFYCLSQEKSTFRSFGYTKLLTGDYLYAVGAMDDDGDPLSFTLQQSPAGMTLDSSSGLLRWPAAAIVAGTHSISIKVADPFGGTAVQNYTLAVEPENLAPRVSAGFDRAVRSASDPLTLLGQADDDGLPAENPFTIQWRQLAGPGTLTFATPQLPTTAVSAVAAGTYLVELSASDGVSTVADVAEVRLAAAAAKAPSGLVAWWPLNGHLQEIVHGNHDFSLTGGAALGAGRVTQGLVFDGADDSARANAHSDLDIGASAAGFSIEFWVKPTVVTYGPMLHWHNGSTDGLHFWTNSGNNEIIGFLVGPNGGTVVAPAAIQPGVWQHVALTYDKPSGVARIYRNGVVVGSSNVGTNYRARTDYDLYLGKNPLNTQAFNGALDEISLYNRALSTAEIRAIFNAASDGKAPLDANTPPSVNAGADLVLPDTNATATLNGTVTDDNRPFNAPPAAQWTKVDGPGAVTFSDSSSATTTATFGASGTYVLQLTASDGLLAPVSDLVEVRVGVAVAEPPSGLVAWWSGNGHARDVISGAHEIDLLRGATLASGKVAQGFAFDGVDDLGLVERSPEIDVGASAAGYTIEFWARPDAIVYGPMLHWHDGTTDGPHLWTNSDQNRITAYFPGNGGAVIDAPRAIEPGVWQHVALTLTKATGLVQIYKNGLLVGSGFISPSYRPRTDYDLGVAGTSGVSQRFRGTLDEISLYNRPLSVAEIRAIIAADANGKALPDDNLPPVVDAGRNVSLPSLTSSATLRGAVTDDNRPFGPPVLAWSVVDGPGAVTFGSPNAATTSASFAAPGTYVLKLTASDRLDAPVSALVEARVAIAPLTPPDGLVAWWPGNGTPKEVVRGIANATLNPLAGYAPGKTSLGFRFNGDGGQAHIAQTPETDVGASSQGFTTELWINPATLTKAPVFTWFSGSTEGLSLWSYPDGRLVAFFPNAAVVDAPGALSAGAWTHIALVFDRPTGVARLYRNGAIFASAQMPAGYRAPTNLDLDLGFTPAYPTNWLDATIDELSLYNRPLSTTEVAGIYNAGSIGKAPPVLNTAPTVNAGADRTAYIGSPLALAATASDDGEPNPPGALTFAWSKVSGPGAALFSAPTALATNVTFDTAGSYTLRLAVSDSALTTTDDVVVTVTPPPSQAPVVAITQPRTGGALPANVPVTLLATASDPDGTIASVEFFRGSTSLGLCAPVSGQPNTYALNTTFTLAQSPLSLTARATDNTGVVAVSFGGSPRRWSPTRTTSTPRWFRRSKTRASARPRRSKA